MNSQRINSRAKGARAERRWRDELRAQGFSARRGQQFSGSADSPDVVCDQLSWLHFEVKAVERLNIWDAHDQAARDARVKPFVIAHTKNFRPWLVTMTAETFFQFLRGTLPPEGTCVPANALVREESKTNNNQTQKEQIV